MYIVFAPFWIEKVQEPLNLNDFCNEMYYEISVWNSNWKDKTKLIQVSICLYFDTSSFVCKQLLSSNHKKMQVRNAKTNTC